MSLGGAEEGLDGLTPEQKRALLATLVARQAQRPSCFPLSFSQQRLWFLDQLSPGNPFYNVEALVPITGVIEPRLLCRTINEIVRRHEVLRTTFRSINGQGFQIVAPRLELELPVVDLRGLPPAHREMEKVRLWAAGARRPFDLARGPLLRLTLLQLGPAESLFLWFMHHIIADGWSMGIFLREIQAIFLAFAAGRPSPLPELPIQYGDFAAWQREWLSGKVLEEQLAYWKGQLAGLEPLELPTDRPRPPIQTFRGSHRVLAFPQPLAGALAELGSREGATLFMTLLAAFQTLLHRYSGSDDVVVGTYIANRNRAETESLIGFFLNTLVLRTGLRGDLRFRRLLHRVREVALGAYAHQDLPFEKLVEELQPERDLSRNPLFQVTFQLQNVPTGDPAKAVDEGLSCKRGTAIFDLALMLFETLDGLGGQLEYSTELFDATTVERMAGHLGVVLEAVARDPEQKVALLPLLTAAERQALLVEVNDTQRPHDLSRGLVQLFAGQADRRPDAVAFVCDGAALSYAELARRARRLAHHLVDLGLTGATVGVCLERSLVVPEVFLGVLAAGAVYLPLDPSYPSARLAFMLEDARAAVLITAPDVEAPEHPAGRVLRLDLAEEEIARCSAAALAVRADPDAPAYVIYTSGSTGVPKGVVATHRQILNRCAWMWEAYPFAPGEVGCQKTALSFVDSLWELLGPLLQGVRTVILPAAATRDLPVLVRRLAEEGVSRLWLVPSLLRALLDAFPALRRELPCLDVWVSSGEALPAELGERFGRAMPGALLFNLYGTSEVWDATWYDPRHRPPGWRVPIGRPIDNVRVYVLDPHRQPVPAGVPGELYVAGLGLARGYLHRQQAGDERFVPLEPVGGHMDGVERAYRTGDLVRFLADGHLESMGRIDRQVKVRGLRVEPAEIETVLERHPEVRQAAVVAAPDGAGGLRLLAWVVPCGAPGPAGGELRRFLLGALPEPMVPSAFLPTEALPLTPSGKLDRNALLARGAVPASEQPYVAPRSPAEEELAKIWGAVLGVERIGVHDNFFELGGHSLKATQVISRLLAACGVELPLQQIFETPTLAGLAEAVARLRATASPSGAAAPIPRLARDRYRVRLDPAAGG